MSALTATLATGAATAPSAFAGILSPESPATSGAQSTHTLYWIGLIVAVLLAGAINLALIRAVRTRREVRGMARQSEQTTPSAQIKVGGALTGLFVILLVAGIVFTEQSRTVSASETDSDPITVDATGQQWLWRYDYPNDAYSYYRLTIPVDTPVTLNVMSTDVVHSWLVPAFGGAVDAVPGKLNQITFVAEEEGVFEGSSGVFSGQAYPAMRTEVAVVSQDEYEDFIETRREETAEAQEDAARGYQERHDEN